VRKAALAGRAWEADFDGFDNAGRPIADHQERIAEPACPQVLEERDDRLGILLGARHQAQKNLLAVGGLPSVACRRWLAVGGLPSVAMPQAASTGSRF